MFVHCGESNLFGLDYLVRCCMKTCIKCGESKDLLQFGKNKLCKDGQYAVRFLCRKHHAEWHSKFETIR